MGHDTFDIKGALRDISAGAVTASSNEPALALPVPAMGHLDCNIGVTAVGNANGNETYTFVMAVDSVADFSDAPVELARVAYHRDLGAKGFPISINEEMAKVFHSDPKFLRVGVELAGSSPTITYGAWLGRS